MNSKKIFFVLPTNKSGGAERVFASLVNYFSSKGHEVSLINFDSNSSFYDIDNKVKVVKLKCDYNMRSKIAKSICLANGIKSCILADKPDIVIGVLGPTEIITAFICIKLGIPFFTSVRNSVQSYGLMYRYLRNYYLPRISGVIFQSYEVMNHKSFRRVTSKIVIPNMLSEQYVNFNNTYLGKERSKKIINVARLEPQKNQSILIKAFYLIHAKNPEFTLHIYGDGSLKNELRKLISQLGLENKVFLEGVLRDAIIENSDASLFVLSSNYEGYPNVLIEAMSSGIPCISTDFDSGIASSLLLSNECGIIVKIGDIEGLAQSIDYMINNSQVALEMAKRALYVKDTLSLLNIGYQWENFIENIIENVGQL